MLEQAWNLINTQANQISYLQNWIIAILGIMFAMNIGYFIYINTKINKVKKGAHKELGKKTTISDPATLKKLDRMSTMLKERDKAEDQS